jgi:hypothetical protein
MKKRHGYYAITVILLNIVIFTGCKGEVTENEKWGKPLGRFAGLSAETENQVLETALNDYIAMFNNLYPHLPKKMTAKDIWVEGYYGTYNGVVAVLFGFSDDFQYDVPAEPPDNPDEIYRLSWLMFYYFRAWKDGVIYSMSQAFDKGYLQKADIERINELYTKGVEK